MSRILRVNPAIPGRRKGVRRFCGTLGLTLIEMLIVMAILAILSVSIGTLVDYTVLGQKELQLRNDLHSECAGVFAAVSQEAAVANECLVAGEAGATTGTLLALRGPAAATTDAAQPPPPRWVLYRLEDRRVTRAVLGEDEALDPVFLTKAVATQHPARHSPQTLATHVNGFAVAVDDTGLLRVSLRAGAAVGRRPIRVEGTTAVALPPGVKTTRTTLQEATSR